jgi:hypothetical protein
VNLLQERRKIERPTNVLTVDNFREYQYRLLPYFCDVMVNYLSKQNNNYLKLTSKTVQEMIHYLGIYNSQVTEMTAFTETLDVDGNYGENKQLFKVYLPTLIDENFFFLNGNLYVPALYVVDLPIVLKKKSMKLFSLFNSITLYMKEDIAIFTGTTIPLSYFIQLFIDNQEDLILYGEFISKFKLNHDQHDDVNIITYFSTKFKQFTTKADIINYLENLFFDDYTVSMYKSCYPDLEGTNIKSILKKAMEIMIDGNMPNFVDLTKKRIVFTEMILRPLLDKFSKLATIVSRGNKTNTIDIHLHSIIKYFLTTPDGGVGDKERKGLSGNHLYKDASLYSGILQNKISMVPPGVEKAPKEVQSIHRSHYGKICPISISSQKPGHVVSVIPGTILDPYGRFA